MGLNADRVDRCPRFSHSLEQIEKRRAARFLLRGVELDIVFIDDEARGRIGFPCDTVDEIEIIRSDRFEKHPRAKSVRAAILGLDRLVDDIPAMDHAAIAASQLLDALDNRALLLLPGRQVEVPARGAMVP